MRVYRMRLTIVESDLRLRSQARSAAVHYVEAHPRVYMEPVTVARAVVQC